MAARVKHTNVDSAWQRAVSACSAAFSAQPVKQADGSTMLLCWSGRVARGLDRIQAMKANGEDTTRIEAAMATLGSSARAAMRVAQDAAEAWATTARAVGQDVDPLACYPAPCQCEGCRNQNLWQAMKNAEDKARDAVAFLLAGSDVEPRLLGYIAGATDAQQRDLLWHALKRIADAMTTYRDAAQAAGEAPDWARVLR